MNPFFRAATIFVLTSFALNSATSKASLIAYEGFDYTPGTVLDGLNGGTGFAGAWHPGGFNASLHNNYVVAPGSLSYSSLPTTGNSIATGPVNSIAGLTRDLQVPLGVSGTTVYMSFVLQPQGSPNAGAFNGFFGLLFEQPIEPEVFMGKPGGGAIGDYVIEDRGGARQYDSNLPVTPGQSTLLVVKADFLSGADVFTLYVNPALSDLEPLTGITKNDADSGLITGITIYSTGAFALDEIRIGTTWADVIGVQQSVPESGPGLAVTSFLFASLFAYGFARPRKSVSL